MSKNTANKHSLDQQTHGHQEGRMNNIAPDSKNNSHGMSDMHPGNKKSKNQPASGETESDRANRNEDEDIRGGNSSI